MASQPPLTRGLLEATPSDPRPDYADERGTSKGIKAMMVGAVAMVLTFPALVVTYGQGSNSVASKVDATGSHPQFLTSTPVWSPSQPGAWETQAFEAMMEFQMPYMDFVEDVYIHSDAARGNMRLSYYNGANVFLVNTTGHSYELVPVAERQSCLVTASVHSLEMVIPDLALFRRKGTNRKVALQDENGVESVGYEFTMKSDLLYTANDSHWSFYKPDSENFVGVYTLLVNASAGGYPVSVTFKGHNPFLVQSHDDVYHILYKSFHPRPEGIDRSFFLPPQGMPCTAYENPTGPFGQLGQKLPMRDFAMMMPGLQGDVHRYAVLREVFTRFNKTCSGSADCGARQHLALRHFRWVQAHNRRGLNYQVGVNHMVDWTPEDRKRLLGRRPSSLQATPLKVKSKTYECELYEKNWSSMPPLPSRVDWREGKLVGPPRDQGTCGSCWAFATIGMLEGQVAKTTGTLTRLAEQQLVDCTWSVGNLACDGGNDADALTWLLKYNEGEVATADSYGRYLSENGFCHFDKSKGLQGLDGVAAPPPGAKQHVVAGAHIKSCWQVAPPDHRGVQAAVDRLSHAVVSVGPISTSVMASLHDFYYYAGGFYDNPQCTSAPEDLDHLVLIAGYGFDTALDQNYWLIRNSWSSHWGEQGYIRIAQKNNLCGIATQAAFALLN